MADDIIARLNEVWEYAPTYPWQRNAINDAKAEIERLQGLLADHGYHGPDCKFGNCWCDESREARRER